MLGTRLWEALKRYRVRRGHEVVRFVLCIVGIAFTPGRRRSSAAGVGGGSGIPDVLQAAGARSHGDCGGHGSGDGGCGGDGGEGHCWRTKSPNLSWRAKLGRKESVQSQPTGFIRSSAHLRTSAYVVNAALRHGPYFLHKTCNLMSPLSPTMP